MPGPRRASRRRGWCDLATRHGLRENPRTRLCETARPAPPARTGGRRPQPGPQADPDAATRLRDTTSAPRQPSSATNDHTGGAVLHGFRWSTGQRHHATGFCRVHGTIIDVAGPGPGVDPPDPRDVVTAMVEHVLKPARPWPRWNGTPLQVRVEGEPPRTCAPHEAVDPRRGGPEWYRFDDESLREVDERVWLADPDDGAPAGSCWIRGRRWSARCSAPGPLAQILAERERVPAVLAVLPLSLPTTAHRRAPSAAQRARPRCAGREGPDVPASNGDQPRPPGLGEPARGRAGRHTRQPTESS